MTSQSEMGDQVTENLYPALFKCFAVILCGYVAGRLNILTQNDSKGLATFVGHFALPSLIFISLANLNFATVNWMFLLSMLTAKSLIFFLVMFGTLFTTKPVNLGRAGLFAIFCTQSNDFALGYPIISAIYDKTHPEFSSYLYLMTPISLVILNPIAYVLLEIGKQRDHNNALELSLRPKYPKLECLWQIFKGILLNPIVAMTVLGLIGNIAFKHTLPVYITGLLTMFGNSFPASALFLLGLRMVGQVHKLHGSALVIPAVLIIMKLVVLPLTMRGLTHSLLSNVTSDTTRELTEYSFLYGVIPTAPAVFVISNIYKMEQDLIASSMVICTFLSAPLMLISAQMLSLSENCSEQIKKYVVNLSWVSLIASAWSVIVFLFTCKVRRMPHRLTFMLILAQIGLSVFSLCEGLLDEEELKEWMVVCKTYFAYSCQMWIACIAFSLFLAQKTTECIVYRMQWFYLLLCFVLPILLTIGTLLLSKTHQIKDLPYDPVMCVIQAVCLLITVCSILLFVRERRRNSLAGMNLRDEFTNLIMDNDDEIRDNLHNSSIAGYGSLRANTTTDSPAGLSEQQSDVQLNSSRHSMNNNELNTSSSPGEGHLIMLLAYSASMVVMLAYNGWTVASSESSGVLVELHFIYVTLLYGQNILPMCIFTLKPSRLYMPVVNRAVGCWYTWRESRNRSDLEAREGHID